MMTTTIGILALILLAWCSWRFAGRRPVSSRARWRVLKLYGDPPRAEIAVAEVD